MRNNNKGFTLIELIMVTIILGILAAVAVPRYMGTVNRAEVSAENAVLSALRANCEGYAMEEFMDNGRKSWPENPFDGASVDGYDVDNLTAYESGDWAFVKDFISPGVSQIRHMRNDKSVWNAVYVSRDESNAQADDTGYLESYMYFNGDGPDPDNYGYVEN